MMENILSQYKREMRDAASSIPHAFVKEALLEIQQSDLIYIAGNGGSAANASQLALHLTDAGKVNVDLSAQSPSITALSNDFGYQFSLSRQIPDWRSCPYVSPCVIVFSGSGNSKNILHLLHKCRGIGIRTIGILGFDGGEALKLVDIPIHVVKRDYGIVEDCHSMIVHMIHRALLSPAKPVIILDEGWSQRDPSTTNIVPMED